MKSGQVLIRLKPPALEWVKAQCALHTRSRAYVVERAVEFAQSNGLDLSSGQARECAEAMGRQG
jgi:hypothetical protein